MGNVNFYLKKSEKKTGRSLIILQFEYSRRKLVFSTKQNIEPKNWDNKKQRVKGNQITTADGSHMINDLLGSLKNELLKTYNMCLKNGIPEPTVLKIHLQAFLNYNKEEVRKANTNDLFGLLKRIMAGEILHQGKKKCDSTLKKYKTVFHHLQNFQDRYGYRVDYETINMEFFDLYVSYLNQLPVKIKDSTGCITIRKGLKTNSIAKDIKIIKAIMNHAVERNETNNLDFRKKSFHVAEEETDSVYLTENELWQLYQYDFKGEKRLDQVRDLFIFGAYVGLRFSDYSMVQPENIVRIDGQYFIKIITQKTQELVVIPCHPIIQELFSKYEGNSNKLPYAPSIQKFNEYIKEVCLKAGLIETGRFSPDPKKPLYRCVTSHTCRRSFATNYYLQGFPTIDLMKITAHRTEEAFLGYIKVSKLDAAKRLAAHMQKRWGKELLLD